MDGENTDLTRMGSKISPPQKSSKSGTTLMVEEEPGKIDFIYDGNEKVKLVNKQRKYRE